VKPGKRTPDKDRRNDARREAAEAVAVAVLAYLASDHERLGHFIAATGIGPERIREAAGDPSFLAGVLDYVAADEPLLLAFAREAEFLPTDVERARAVLSDVWERDTP
jgi:hypothetical protein